MLILGIESSCDDAAVALVEDGQRVLSEAAHSQADDFRAWGGVVPELAARSHVAALPTLVERALQGAGLNAAAIDGIAVGAWPGLIGSLLAGTTCAKMLAARLQRPLAAVDHIQAHVAAIHLHRASVPYPLVALVASGGHSHIYRCDAPGEMRLLGGTIDDAAGEAFDKVAAIMDLPYPGGPAIDRIAEQGDARAIALPRSFLHDDTLRLSFAGVKTALLYAVRGRGGAGPLPSQPQRIADAAASFRAAVVECLVSKTMLAARQQGVATVAIAGGVACNRALRAQMQAACARAGMQVLMPAPEHCADNAAMIAALGFFQICNGHLAGADLVPLPTGRAGPRAPQPTAIGL